MADRPSRDASVGSGVGAGSGVGIDSGVGANACSTISSSAPSSISSPVSSTNIANATTRDAPRLLRRSLLYAFDALHAHLSCGQLQKAPDLEADYDAEHRPLFVSWHTGKLRGCLGTLEPIESFADALRHYAVASATQDHRFRPMSLAELPSATCHISILSDFEPCSGVSDWTIGIHGIVVECGGRQATFLPHVAASQGWSHCRAVRGALSKAGLRQADVSDASVTRYITFADQMHHDEWLSHRSALRAGPS